MFQSWVHPKFLHGVPVWIFQTFHTLDLNEKSRYGCGTIYNKLKMFYVKSAKFILDNTQNMSTLVLMARTGWLPFKYELMIQDITWLKRIVVSKDSEVNQLYQKLKFKLDDDYRIWEQTIFFKHAHDLMYELEDIYNEVEETNINLLHLDINEFKEIIKKAVYYRFNYAWYKQDKDHYTRDIMGTNSVKKVSRKKCDRKNSKSVTINYPLDKIN